MKRITSLTEKDEIVLNLLTSQIAKASGCRISNKGGMCRSDREAVAGTIGIWKRVYDYGVKQIGYDLTELEQWAKDNHEELDTE